MHLYANAERIIRERPGKTQQIRKLTTTRAEVLLARDEADSIVLHKLGRGAIGGRKVEYQASVGLRASQAMPAEVSDCCQPNHHWTALEDQAVPARCYECLMIDEGKGKQARAEQREAGRRQCEHAT